MTTYTRRIGSWLFSEVSTMKRLLAILLLGVASLATAALAEGQATVSYNYNAVPSPAAAATMLIGIVGGLRRRRNA